MHFVVLEKSLETVMTDRVRSMTSFAACTDGAAEACGCQLPRAVIKPSQSADCNL